MAPARINPPDHMDELTHKRRERAKVRVPYRGGMLEAESAELAAEAIADMERSRKMHERKIERWGADNCEQMRRLCASFPCLREVPGSDPWDAHTLLAWVLGPAPSSGGWHAALFVLQVWNCGEDWCQVACELGLLDASAEGFQPFQPFNVARAFGTWDEAHREAFRAWCELPFHP